jgi:iron complex outermembrane receptor protein
MLFPRNVRAPLAAAVASVTLLARADHMEEIVVRGVHDTRTIEVSEAFVISPDTSQLLRRAPGANVNSNGPLSGIPQYRGMYGPRVGVQLDGMELAPAGPNWMDPPLSYAAAAQLESLKLYRGIAPVSVAQESIGGVVSAVTAQRDFVDGSAMEWSGRLLASGQTVNEGTQAGATLFGTSRSRRLRVSAMTEQGDDAGFSGGEILPSEYQRDRFDISYGQRWGAHTVDASFVHSKTGDTGTPALPMDIDYIEGDLYSIGYRFERGDWSVDGKLFYSDLDHEMTNYHLRQVRSAAAWRRNATDSENLGFKLSAVHRNDQGSWTLGVDGLDSTHNSDIDNPNAPAFFVTGFNDARRRVLGVFAEGRHQLGGGLRSELGLRYNRVDMDADRVDGTPAMMMPPAAALRDAFNAADRDQADHNVDAIARLWYDASDGMTLYAGVARKTRSPSYQERYLWLPLQATGGLADGRTYTGSIGLDPEVAHEVELGVDLNSARLTLSPRLFYRDVDDYIQGVASEDMRASMLVAMMNPGAPAPLQFQNTDARFWGFDMDWSLRLSGALGLRGLVNYVRGERQDVNDNIYRIAPFNATLGLDYRDSHWGLGVEAVYYAEQDEVSEINGELPSSDYALVNLNAWWQLRPSLRLAAGIDNLFDENYQEHLGGVNRVAGNPDLAVGERLPGYGINGFLRVDYSF